MHNTHVPTGNESEFNARVGRRIAEVRAAKNLTQKQLAVMIDRSSSMITKLEKGSHSLTPYRLKMVADALEVSIAHLFEEVEGAPSEPQHDVQEWVDRVFSRAGS